MRGTYVVFSIRSRYAGHGTRATRCVDHCLHGAVHLQRWRTQVGLRGADREYTPRQKQCIRPQYKDLVNKCIILQILQKSENRLMRFPGHHYKRHEINMMTSVADVLTAERLFGKFAEVFFFILLTVSTDGRRPYFLSGKYERPYVRPSRNSRLCTAD